jgi:hypothetical protein
MAIVCSPTVMRAELVFLRVDLNAGPANPSRTKSAISQQADLKSDHPQ